MLVSYKYRLFPNRNQLRELSKTLETHRRLYNQVLDNRQFCWDMAQVSWTFFQQCRWLTSQRKTNQYLAALNVSSAVETLRKLDNAYSRFFAAVKSGTPCGFPRFKSFDRFNSFSFFMTGNAGGCKIINRKLRLQNIGTIRVRWHREIPDGGVLRKTTIRRDGDKWFVCFCVDLPDREAIASADSAGIDLGIKSFVTTSHAESLGESSILRKCANDLRRKQRALSRCRRGSNRRKKVKARAAAVHAKVANTRRDMQHKVARSLVNRYGFIAAESLNVQGMIKNRRLARSIADAGWGQFISILQHKAACAGATVVLVDAKNTSQQCSKCGEMVPKALSVRVHRCSCGCVLDRDVNAAINILARAAPTELNAGVTQRVPKSRRVKAMK